MQTSTSRDQQRWATAYKDITTVIRRPEKTCQKKPLWGKKSMTRNLGKNHGPNSAQLAARPTRLHSFKLK